MGVIKLGIISLVFFALLITGISLFIPSHVRISRATDINAKREVVLAHLNNPVNWKAWYPGADSSDYFMVDGKIKGITTGDLQGLIINEASDSTISTVNAGPNSRQRESGWNIFNGRTPNTVTVQWYMDIHLRWYPWDKFSSLLLEKRYGPMMELGLDKLKKLLEKEDKL